MRIIHKLKKINEHNRQVVINMMGAFVVKGATLIISVLLLPVYLRFFENQMILGIWYTILSVLNWVVLFDLGLGQGLRNQLPSAFEVNDTKTIRESISTTYVLMSLVTIVITLIGMIGIPFLDWNNIFNVDPEVVSNNIMIVCVQIIFLGIMLQIILKIITSILYALQQSAVVNFLGLITNIIIITLLMITPSKDVESNLVMMSVINVIAANLPYLICTMVVFRTTLKDAVPSIKYFSNKYIKEIFNVGVSLLFLQVVFMVVSSTNEFLISSLTDPEYVVEYQVYNKVFKTAAMVLSLALTPIWSAVTKAQAQKNYSWIIRVYKLFLGGAILCFVGELCIVPILQWVINIWLGKNIIIVNVGYAIAFVFSSVIFLVHNINTAVGNGLSYFRLQMGGMTFAAVVFIPLSYVMVELTGSWIGVVIANIISVLPYEVLAPIFTMKLLKRKASENREDLLKSTVSLHSNDVYNIAEH